MTRKNIKETLETARRKKNQFKSTNILEVDDEFTDDFDSPYPYCKIPAHYFDRPLAAMAKAIRPELSIERW